MSLWCFSVYKTWPKTQNIIREEKKASFESIYRGFITLFAYGTHSCVALPTNERTENGIKKNYSEKRFVLVERSITWKTYFKVVIHMEFIITFMLRVETLFWTWIYGRFEWMPFTIHKLFFNAINATIYHFSFCPVNVNTQATQREGKKWLF